MPFMGTGWSDHLGDTAAEQTLTFFGGAYTTLWVIYPQGGLVYHYH
jgi:hypothetical protein